MFEIVRETINWGGRALTLETGLMARQADGAVLVTYGETQVLCTVVFQKKPTVGQNFFPLTVHYQEKAFAAGKIPGGFFKREGRPSEQEILTSRLIDRPIRPLFPEFFRNETQVIATVLSYDGKNSPDIPAMIGSSAALSLSGVPFLGPIAGAQVGYKNGQYILNPTTEQLQESCLQLIVAGTNTGVLMVESEAKELSEDIMLDAVMFGFKAFQPVINTINDMMKKVAKAPYQILENDGSLYSALLAKVRDQFESEIISAYKIVNKQERCAALSIVQDSILSVFPDEENNALKALEDISYDVMRSMVLKDKKRIDGRDLTDVRPIDCRVGVIHRVHGSALFTRGETQALVIATLGTAQDEQILDALEGENRLGFMLHYNFPPYSVGEVGRLGSPGRREIGHGKLAWKALHPLLPAKESFAYTLRLVSEITESNGSSSMATVCGSSLALMDAGVPLIRPCAGIAMGLIKENNDIVVLSDILGDEDYLGDMDFKVAGTEIGITALQMDIKITSVTEEIIKLALNQARIGRMHILHQMNKVLAQARQKLSDFAPRMNTFIVPKDKIREIIGTGGKIIREICENTGAKIDITDDGQVTVSAVDKEKLDTAIKMIKDIVAEIEIGKIYHGKVVKLMDFGAFVNCVGSHDGLVHISEISNARIEKVEDVLQEGQMVWVKCLEIDKARKRVKLSMKCIDQTTGETIEYKVE